MMWDLTSIPCKHAISAIYKLRHFLEDYVHVYYRKKTYMEVYKHLVYPVPSHCDWVQTGYDPILPSLIRKQPKRPKKLRKMDADEPRNPFKATRKNIPVSCGKCLKQGHNISSYKNAPHPKSKRFKSTQANSSNAHATNVEGPFATTVAGSGRDTTQKGREKDAIGGARLELELEEEQLLGIEQELEEVQLLGLELEDQQLLGIELELEVVQLPGMELEEQ
ncbi:unnamed protein product [Ilex paraguariensis]|uniref:Zinc finger PMZ-type domain-containing protein n=1 Tax=Ilex paraguariensis TaxID=185542 RepID=A0ABC8URG5_9AQUA